MAKFLMTKSGIGPRLGNQRTAAKNMSEFLDFCLTPSDMLDTHTYPTLQQHTGQVFLIRLHLLAHDIVCR